MASAEVGAQVDDVGVEAGEHEAPVGLNAFHPPQPELVEVHSAGVGVPVRDAFELPFGVEGPRVVEALEHFGIAGILPADHRAAVRAGVVENVDVAGFHPADHEDRPSRDRSSDEVAGLGDLGFVADIQPRLGEDPVDLGPVDVR